MSEVFEKLAVDRIIEVDDGVYENRFEDSVMGRWGSFYIKVFN